MALELYNSQTRKKEIFTKPSGETVGLYSCGPTVYNYPHIGNYRAYLFADILRRALLYNNFPVTQIMNITDIDDKTIRDSQIAGKSLKEFTEFYTQEFFKDRDALGIMPASEYTKATDYVGKMIKLIETLLEKGFAYKEDDGSVYFSISKDEEYGKLNHITLDELKQNAAGRMKKDEYEKENAQDFALWKAWDETDGEVFWESPFGKGRPGWHIECSAMSMAKLGETIDIHTGGKDNMFPHHENEIAQSECATGKEFVRYWMHNEWLLVEGKKMAKSAGNFYTLRDIIEKGITPRAFRLWMLMAHYRTPANFNIEALQGAETALKRLYRLTFDLGKQAGTVIETYKERFLTAINNDLATPEALTVLWEVLANESFSKADRFATVIDFDRVLGLGLANLKNEELPSEILELAQKRDAARTSKDWALSDKLRDELIEKGYEVSDSDRGTKVRKI